MPADLTAGRPPPSRRGRPGGAHTGQFIPGGTSQIGGPVDDPPCAVLVQLPAIGGQKTGPSLRSRRL